MSDWLNQLLDDPTLPEAVAVLTHRLNAERQRRELFYEEVTEDQKAEFINGEVIMNSPARSKHLEASRRLIGLFGAHVDARQQGYVAVEKALCVFPRNDYEPDVVYFGPEKARSIKPNTLKFPVPDLICEVLSESTEARDRGVKFKDYAAHEVAEYWIVDTESETLEQYLLTGNTYSLRTKASSGEVESSAVAGFQIPVRAIFDSETYVRTLRQLLSTG